VGDGGGVEHLHLPPPPEPAARRAGAFVLWFHCSFIAFNNTSFTMNYVSFMIYYVWCMLYHFSLIIDGLLCFVDYGLSCVVGHSSFIVYFVWFIAHR